HPPGLGVPEREIGHGHGVPRARGRLAGLLFLPRSEHAPPSPLASSFSLSLHERPAAGFPWNTADNLSQGPLPIEPYFRRVASGITFFTCSQRRAQKRGQEPPKRPPPQKRIAAATYSPTPTMKAVPSAQGDLTTGFEKDPGVTLPP